MTRTRGGMDESMDITSDPALGESQATQILQDVFRVQPDANRMRRDFDATRADASKDISSDTTTTSFNASSVPASYQFYGLANSQPENLFDNDRVNESCRKEDTPKASGRKLTSGSPFLPLHELPFHTKIDSYVENTTRHPPSRTLIAPNPASKATITSIGSAKGPFHQALQASSSKTIASGSSFGSSINTPANRGVPHRSTNLRMVHNPPLDPESQDSFAGDISQNLEKKFLASTKQFDIPLSELGRDSVQETPIEATVNDKKVMHTPSRPNHLFVAASPSHSGSSQGQSQSSQQHLDSPDPFDYRNYIGTPPQENRATNVRHDDATQLSTQQSDVQPSSSFGQLLVGDQHSDAPTQPTDDIEATQISEPPNPVVNVRANTTDWSSNAPGVSTPIAPSAASTGPRSLLSMINPAKKWKLDELRKQAAPPRQHVALPMPPNPLVFQETQPSGLNDDQPTPNRNTLSWRADKDKMVNRNVVPSRQRSPVRPDATEIVPDSEPLTEQTPESPSRTLGPPVKAPRNAAPSSEIDSGEIVPDSVEMYKNEDDDDDDDDDDIPLAAAVMSKKGSRSAKRIAKEIEETETKGKAVLQHEPKSKPRSAPAHPTGGGHSWETGEVPSSVPEQDLKKLKTAPPAPVPGPSRKQETNKTRRSGKPSKPTSVPGATKRSGRSTSTVVPSKRRRVSSDTEEDDVDEMDIIAQKASLVIPVVRKEEEEETEPAEDDDYMDVDEKPTVELPPRPKRETRGGKTSKSSSRSSRPPQATPVARRIKPLRSTFTSSTSRSAAEAPTRVFALWKQDGHYYSGTLHSISPHSNTRYVVKFDDETDDIVDISKLRRCELIVGDQVILVNGNQKATVVNDSRGQRDGTYGVEVDDGNELDCFDVSVGDVRIAGRTLTRQWGNRTISVDTIVTVVKPKILKGTPSPSKASMASGSTNRGTGRKALCKTGLVVTLSVGNNNWEKEKDNVMLAIKNKGGVVLDDWTSAFEMNGKHSNSNQRWVISKGDIKWTQKEGIDRVFLLADDANQKPKFLIALALGIPCLSIDWLHYVDSQDWQAHLLPAGFCETLDARVSQMVDFDWGNSIEYLNDIAGNRVASKLFKDMSILCLDADFVPLQKSKRQNSSDLEKAASRTVPRIILAMGAARVEAASDKRFVSDPTLESFDFIILKDLCEADHQDLPAESCVPLSWVKECLIAGRFLARPGW